MKTLALILTAALLAAGCNILSESSSNHEGDNYEEDGCLGSVIRTAENG